MKKDLGHEAIYDARQLGTPRMLILGLQHMFAMFGATVLVPILVQRYGLPLSIQTTLLFAGLGTLLFHVCTKFKVPAFLGSSFAYLGGFSTVATMPAYEGLDPETKLAYALGGIVGDDRPTLYDRGGILPPGRHLVANETKQPELVLTREQILKVFGSDVKDKGDRTVNLNVSIPERSDPWADASILVRTARHQLR